MDELKSQLLIEAELLMSLAHATLRCESLETERLEAGGALIEAKRKWAEHESRLLGVALAAARAEKPPREVTLCAR